MDILKESAPFSDSKVPVGDGFDGVKFKALLLEGLKNAADKKLAVSPTFSDSLKVGPDSSQPTVEEALLQLKEHLGAKETQVASLDEESVSGEMKEMFIEGMRTRESVFEARSGIDLDAQIIMEHSPEVRAELADLDAEMSVLEEKFLELQRRATDIYWNKGVEKVT